LSHNVNPDSQKKKNIRENEIILDPYPGLLYFRSSAFYHFSGGKKDKINPAAQTPNHDKGERVPGQIP
jgi:hypothetical protein